jgi:ATP synthase F1 gamma subunit
MKLLSQIKADMEFNHNLYNLIEVLKEISLSQYHVLEKKIKSFQRIFDCLGSIFAMVNIQDSEHPLIDPGNRQPGVIAITSDTGLLGGLNLQVMNLALKDVELNKAKLIIVGEKGQIYARETDIPFVAFPGIKDEDRLSQALGLRDYIMKEEVELRLGQLKVIYPYPISIVAQRVQTLQLLPFVQSGPDNPVQEAAPAEMIKESSVEDIAGFMVFLLLGHKFHEVFGLSRLAELSARFVHLEDSKTKIEQLNKQLRLQYFRQRHEMIDRNMRELFAARLAFK